VADEDLASADPYLPDCRPSSGKRVAIIGAGPTGLAAAYYLSQNGHACVLFDDQEAAGGRLRHETSEEELPRSVLEAEIQQILRLGVELRSSQPIENRQSLDKLCETFDAVLLAWGLVPAERLAEWKLKSTRRGVDADRDSWQTERPGLFAAGTAVRGKALVVRSTADGKEAAASISRYLLGEPARGPGRPFSSRIGRVEPNEMQAFLAGADDAARHTPEQAEQYTAGDASEQAHRCLSCGCESHGNCRLERYAQLYGVDPSRFGSRQRSYEVIGREGSVLFEPGKCIKCGLCIEIAAQTAEPLGLTFVGRGFDVRLTVPFRGGMDDALTKAATECVAACPTGALYFDRQRTGCSGGGSCGHGAGQEGETPQNPVLFRISGT
jgi:ferredoxin